MFLFQYFSDNWIIFKYIEKTLEFVIFNEFNIEYNVFSKFIHNFMIDFPKIISMFVWKRLEEMSKTDQRSKILRLNIRNLSSRK